MRAFVLGCALAATSCGGGMVGDAGSGGGSEDTGGGSGGASAETGTPTTGAVDPCDGPMRCPADGAWPFELLSEYDFFQGPMLDLVPKDGVVPYQVGAALWADHAGKGRFIVLPEGGKIEFADGADDWSFPDGTILIKTFFFDHDRRDPEAGYRIIETRLLIRANGAWEPHTYLWNDEQTEAKIIKTGKRIDVSFIDVDGVMKEEEYIVPNLDQCASCHERDDVQHSLGLVTLQMNRMVDQGGMVNQIDWLADQGMFATAPPKGETLPGFVDPMGTDGTLDERARGYLHGNCSHCHRTGGGASNSGLVFLATEMELWKVGVCKVPAAAGPGTGGHAHDIEPGDPDSSIVIFRMNSLDPEIKMPELPNRVIDAKGVDLIREWIASLPAEPCGTP